MYTTDNTNTNITSKANGTLGFQRRNLKISSKRTKELAYKALVRPTLEYASTVWDPHEKGEVKKLEMVQRRAARFVCGRYHNRSSVSSMIQDLGWPSLQQRRYEARVIMLYKIHHSIVYCAVPLPPPARPLRLSHDQALQTFGSRTNARKFSFFPKTVRDWNALYQETVQCDSVEEFKSSLRCHQC